MASSLGDIGVEQSEVVDPLHVELDKSSLLLLVHANMQEGACKNAVLRIAKRELLEVRTITSAVILEQCTGDDLNERARSATRGDDLESEQDIDEIGNLSGLKSLARDSLGMARDNYGNEDGVKDRASWIGYRLIQEYVSDAYLQRIEDEQCKQAVVDGLRWSREQRAVEASA